MYANRQIPRHAEECNVLSKYQVVFKLEKQTHENILCSIPLMEGKKDDVSFETMLKIEKYGNFKLV